MNSPSVLSSKQMKAIIAGAVALFTGFSVLVIDGQLNSSRGGYTQQSIRKAVSLDTVAVHLSAEEQPIITTFFDSTEEGCCGMTKQGHENLVASWKRAWQGRGWQTRIFTEADARKHPHFELLQDKLIKANVSENDRRRFWRWLAMATDNNVLGGWMSDYDLFPLTLTSNKGLALMSQPGFKTYYGGNVPALIHADQASWEKIVQTMIEVVSPDMDIELISDMMLLDYLRKHYPEEFKGVTSWENEIWKAFPYKRVPGLETPVIDCEVATSHLAAHLSHVGAREAFEVTYTYPNIKQVIKPGEYAELRAQAANVMMADLDQCTYFRIRHLIDHPPSPVYPSQILIEIINPKPHLNYWYSVTIESSNRYSGRATLITQAPDAGNPALLFLWAAPFSGTYDIIVHELRKQPLSVPQDTIPLPVQRINVRVKHGYQDPWEQVVDRMKILPPCQTVERMDAYTNVDGTWIGPGLIEQAQLSAQINKMENTLRNEWMFLPSEEMDCKIETFGENEFKLLTEEKSIYILGSSIDRGIFLSLVDLLLNGDEKKEMKESVISKCWGRAVVSKNNVKVMYQDWRSDNFDARPSEPTVVCHNEKVARDGGSHIFDSGMRVWEEIFQGDRASWPQVILMRTGSYFGGYNEDLYDINQFVMRLPPDWDGTLFLTDGEFSARRAGRGYDSEYKQYRARLQELTIMTNDGRVRWLDGIGLSKDMIMYGEAGPEHTAFSQHFHRDCDETYEDANGELQSMRVCSNVTENVAQLLIGHALGPKAALIARSNEVPSNALRLENFGQNRQKIPSSQVIICHNCPENLLPFHITPYPDMSCTIGPLHARTVDEISDEPQTCPEKCMGLTPLRSFGSQSDQIHERHCPYEFFPEGFQVGN